MVSIRRVRSLISTLLVAAITLSISFALPATARAQQPDVAGRFVVYPADAPNPALKYQLLPSLVDRRPGNAAVWYGKVTAEQTHFFSNQEIWEPISDWAALPLAEVRENEQLRAATADNEIFRKLERAARSEHCDWQLPIRDEPFYQILLSEVQQTRQFARLLAVRARRQIAEGDFEGAVRTMQSGYAMAGHVAEGPTLVNALVGFAQSNIMSRQLQDFVQQPDAPNLYWALTALPDPLIDARPGIEAELAAFELTFPNLRELHRTEYGQDYWKQQLESVWEQLDDYSNGALSGETPSLFWRTVRGYPLAKQGLIDAGWLPERVEAMPVPQVVLVYSVSQYQRRRDEQMKWLLVAHPASHFAAVDGNDASEADEILPLFDLLVPVTQAFRYSAANAQRQIAILRLVEAIRMYGAEHNGQLPPSLEAITEVPLPLDPINGKPFGYRLEVKTAVIEGAPLHWHPDTPPERWEVRFAPAPSP